MATYTIPGLTVNKGSLPANSSIQFGKNNAPINTVQQGYTPPKPQVLGASTYRAPTTNYNTPSTPTPTNNNQGYQQIQQAQDNGNAQIEADYNQAMAMLGGAEQGLRGQADTASAQISNEGAKTMTDLGAQQATQEQGVQSNLSTAEKQSTSALQQARDLFRQTQQQNNAQLSALGISSSSVAEALAERLGVETARRIAGVTGSLQEVRQNATNELGRIKDYYAQKTTQLQQDIANQKAVIQNSLIQGLNQINSAKSKAASDKSAARANLLSQVQSQLGQLTMQQQQFEQSLQQWAAQKAAALTPIAQDPNYIQKLVSTAQTFNKEFQPTGFSFTPELSYDKNGVMTGRITSQKRPAEEDIVNPFATQK